jgi:hypothetical protein
LWLILGVTFSLVLVLVVVLSSVAYRYRISLQYCCLVTRGLYRHYRKLDSVSKEHQYDAFVAYSADDYKRSEINVTSSNAFFYLDLQYLLLQLVSKYVFYCFSGQSGEISENLKVLPEYC